MLDSRGSESLGGELNEMEVTERLVVIPNRLDNHDIRYGKWFFCIN